MTPNSSLALTFDALCRCDLESVYDLGRQEVLRDHAFRILLERCDSVAKLEKLAFHRAHGLAGWKTKELIEITNHFRLLSSPENEIRIYRECQNEAFCKAARVREFYLLALNKAGRPLETIQEGRRIIAEGGQSTLVWITLGESYSARMFFAERLSLALAAAGGDITLVDPSLVAQCPRYFSEVDPTHWTAALAKTLRQKNLRLATRIFHRGFRESGSSYAGLGWMLRTIDYLRDLAVELAVDEIKAVGEELACQAALVGIALELQGGRESLDYWTHAGRLLLALISGTDLPAIRVLLAHLFAVSDADFKLATTAAELRRIRSSYAAIAQTGTDSTSMDRRLEGLDVALAELDAGRARSTPSGGRGAALTHEYRALIANQPVDAAAAVLKKTINFRTLTSNLVSLHVRGGIGAVGARMPDLLINRQVQEDLDDLVETKILQPLAPEQRGDPRAVIARIQQVVGAGLRVDDLQDLQSPAHRAFDIRSDGLIALAGIDENMRKNTRTATELTAALLIQNGDCRETMYLNGALFACWQQRQVTDLIAKAMLFIELDYQEGFELIVRQQIPDLMRYQLRGGQCIVYVDSIAMRTKYQYERTSDDDPTAVLRRYGVDELRAGEPLTRYELGSSKLEVTYRDGSTSFIQPQDPATPLEHTLHPNGGVPVIANAENIASLRVLNIVEEHALTFLYDEREKTMELCDGFYNDALFESPYAFSRGRIAMQEIHGAAGLISAGSRELKDADGTSHQRPVYLEFLFYSQTDYEYALMEGDIPGTVQLMGRIFKGDLKRERRRLDEGTSPIPELLKRVQQWQLERQEQATSDRKATERRLARLILDLARNRSELVQMIEVDARVPLISEGFENANVYLVLSGQLQVHRYGRPLCDDAGHPIVVSAGEIAGELSSLRGGVASATVTGDGVVLAIARPVIQEHLRNDPAFRRRMEELASYRSH